MAHNDINIGTAADNGTGDNLRIGGQKINANFVYLEENKLDTRLANVVSDLSTAEKDAIKTKLGVTGGGTATSRTVKQITNTTQYTVIAADFTDFILEFTANANEEISIVINSGVAPLNGELQMISTGNNKLVPSLTGVTATYPEQTNPKTILKGWLGGIVVGTDKISFNGSLESTATAGIEEAPQDGTAYNRKDAGWVAAVDNDTTYTTFTDTEDGLVPAPNVGGSTTYSATITSPTEGFTATEGEVTTVNVDLPAGVVSEGTTKVLESSGWVDKEGKERPIKTVTTGSYTFVNDDENYFIKFTGTAVDIFIPDGLTITKPLLGVCTTATAQGSEHLLIASNIETVTPTQGFSSKIKGGGQFRVDYQNSEFILSGDLVRSYEIFESPNGTLYKAKITDLGQWDITAL
jgi:phosphotransferase system IIB component